MASYTNLLQEIPADKAYVKEVSLAEDEQYIGVYENFPGETREAIVITNHGMHILRDEIIFVPFLAIKDIETPGHITSREGLTLILANDEVVNLMVIGGEGNIRDRYLFLTFLQGARSDLSRITRMAKSS